MTSLSRRDVGLLLGGACDMRCPIARYQIGLRGRSTSISIVRRHSTQAHQDLRGSPTDCYCKEMMVLPDRIELSTSPLPMECSTTELPQRLLKARAF